MTTYESYGFPIDAGEQATALHLNSGGGDVYIHAQGGGVDIESVLKIGELQLLEVSGIIDVQFM